MAEALALAGARWVMSPIITKVLNEGFTHLEINMANKIQNLETTILPQFESLIEAAEKSPHKNKLEQWLKKLKVALYDAEDAVDEYEYHLMESKVTSELPTMVRLYSFSMPSSLRYTFSMMSQRNIKLRKRLNKLEKTVSESITFRRLLAVETTSTEETPAVSSSTISLVKNKVFGRDKERDQLIRLLLQQQEGPVRRDDCCFAVHAIVGLGGVGKTTLAQYVYNDPRIASCFDVRVWVSVSHHSDMFSLMRQMIESASRNKSSGLNLHALPCTLMDLLEFKRFLVVLDDVSGEEWMNEDHVERLLYPLRAGLAGSQILLTSRTERAAKVFRAQDQNIMALKELEIDDMLSIIMHHAFHDVQRDIDPHEKEKLVEIGKQIAKKVKGSPLAAKAIGNQLRKNLDIRAWTRILGVDMSSSETQVLVWSYKRLPAELQRCFSYCSIFPKGHRFERRKMVLLWMAEGFINLPKGRGSAAAKMEDIGYKYFDELLSMSFFNLPDVSDGDSDEYYLMHDLLHDLAEMVSKDDCFRLLDIIDDIRLTDNIPLGVRHLSVRANKLREHKDAICRLKDLRTLIVIDGSIADVNSFLEDLLRNLKKLRVLSLSHCGVEILPEYIGHLKHLRYLDISSNPLLSVLPESLCKLYHLQSLNLSGCGLESLLPKELNNLLGLRHLDGEGKLISTIPEIGRLTSLQELKEFHVKRERGFELKQLRNMREIHGMLHIRNLELVEGYARAAEAELEKKERLEGLRLEWDWGPHCDLEMFGREYEVLEGLRPHDSLKELRIKYYIFPIFPNWMMQRSSLPNLETLHLSNFRQIRVLPNINQVFPRLSTVVLKYLFMLKRLSSFPPTLKKVVIKECPLLAFLFKEEVEMGGFGIPQLEIVLENAKSIGFEIRLLLQKKCGIVCQLMRYDDREIPEYFVVTKAVLETEETAAAAGVDYSEVWHRCLQQQLELVSGMQSDEELQLLLPPSLEELNIYSCIFTDRALSVCLLRLSCLTRLYLYEISLLTSLPSEQVLSNLAKLELLDVRACWFLTSLGGIHALPSLKDLTVHICPSVGGTARLPSSLCSLTIGMCKYPEDLLDRYGYNSQIRSLTVGGCPCTVSLPLGHLTSLHELTIAECKNLSSLQGLGALCSLKTLSIRECPNLVSESDTQLPKEEAALLSSSIEKVTLDNPLLLDLLLSQQALASLSELNIMLSYTRFFTQLQQDVFQHLTSLRQLAFVGCALLSLPADIKFLSLLQTLWIKICPNILFLPDLPPSLKTLWIEDCSSGLRERCQEGAGADWHKIVSIPFKVIK